MPSLDRAFALEQVHDVAVRIAEDLHLHMPRLLDQAFDVAVRPGLHCAPYIHRSLGTFPEGTMRVSPGAFSTEEDIDQLVHALAEIAATLKHAGAASVTNIVIARTPKF